MEPTIFGISSSTLSIISSLVALAALLALKVGKTEPSKPVVPLRLVGFFVALYVVLVVIVVVAKAVFPVALSELPWWQVSTVPMAVVPAIVLIVFLCPR